MIWKRVFFYTVELPMAATNVMKECEAADSKSALNIRCYLVNKNKLLVGGITKVKQTWFLPAAEQVVEPGCAHDKVMPQYEELWPRETSCAVLECATACNFCTRYMWMTSSSEPVMHSQPASACPCHGLDRGAIPFL
ncbi:unnamed protein product [Musa hybrid cultivar]